MTETILYRDEDYGALGLALGERHVHLYDHGFFCEDLDAVLGVIESQGGRITHERDGSSTWACDSHPAAAMSALKNVLASLGYSGDPLGERYANTSPSDTDLSSPDLPTSSKMQVSEAVRRAMRAHLDVAVSALSRSGDLSESDLSYFKRRGGLPFLRYRAILQRPLAEASDIQETLREALSPVRGALQRATVKDVTESGSRVYAIEVAVAPSSEACDAFVRRRLPVFESSDIQGIRPVRYLCHAIVDTDDLQAVAERAAACTAAISIVSPNNRTIVARVPGTHLGDSAADYGFGQRLAWLHEQFSDWDAELDAIGEVEPITKK